VILLGAFLTDINLGVFTARLDPEKSIYATSEKLAIGLHNYEEVGFEDFVHALQRARWRRRSLPRRPRVAIAARPAKRPGDRHAPLRVARLFARLNEFLTPNTIVIADVGDALFGAADLVIRQRTEFLGPAYYTSMGFAVPAAIGAQMADENLRPLVLVGDGAFQMTGLELATIARNHLNPIVVVLNNAGFGTERPMQDGPYNDVAPLRYHRLPEILGTGRGWLVRTEAELDAALVAARAHMTSFSLIEVILDPHDRSPALQRLTVRFAKKIG
jgi:TPP-dependent 2-oxoacid decarboxylase